DDLSVRACQQLAVSAVPLPVHRDLAGPVIGGSQMKVATEELELGRLRALPGSRRDRGGPICSLSRAQSERARDEQEPAPDNATPRRRANRFPHNYLPVGEDSGDACLPPQPAR